MRRLLACLLPVLAVAAAQPAPAAADTVTLTVAPAVARYDSVVRFSGTADPAREQGVAVFVGAGDDWRRVLAGTTAPDGTFAFEARVRGPGAFVARTETAESAPVALPMRPRLVARVSGRRSLGRPLRVSGRLLPAEAGELVLRLTGRRARRVAVAADGGFRTRLPTGRGGRYRAALVVRPAEGFVPVRRRWRIRIAQPELAWGARGAAVRVLERRLRKLRYVLRRVDRVYRADTYEAVLAFQKVHGMARTGAVDRAFWRAFWRAAVPQPRVRLGSYLEVDKTRQVLFEVRRGRVVSVVHVSTGKTGNTPVGTWRVYRKVVGWDWVLWYPLYFLRGFAIHGYPSVPPYPASHGCVRVPMWFAAGLWSRWPYRSIVRVYP